MPEIIVMWRETFARAHLENQQRRERVLRHPDLAARLCRPPLGFSRPENWNGFVAPRFLPDDRPFGAPGPERLRLNDSPRRAAIVEICAEALRREGEQGE